MTIAIDTTFFGHEETENKNLVNSTSIFTADLLDEFSALGHANNCTLIVSKNQEAFFKERFPQYKRLVLQWLPLTILNKISKGRFRGTKYIKKFGIYRRRIEKERFDIIWFPFAGDYTFVKSNTPGVLTIHDLWGFHSNLNNFKGYKGVLDEKRNTIVTISEYTKKDFIRIFNYKKEIAVIPNTIQVDISATAPVPELKNKFILDINAYNEKKNPITLLKAFNRIKNDITHDLVFCGGYKDNSVYTELIDFIQQNHLESRVRLFFKLPTEQRNFLLENASLFVTPSLFEGFGRTPVEAAICGIPVISTKETALYEATLGLVNYVENATDDKELADSMLEKIKHPDSPEELQSIAQALKNAYALETCARKYWNIFVATSDKRQATITNTNLFIKHLASFSYQKYERCA